MHIREFIENEGIKILFRTLIPGTRGSMFQKENQWYIVVNRHDPPERQNFTIAHEYCEIQLHDDPGLTKDEKHRRANQAASELLLPQETFGQAVHKMDLHALKEAFPEVSYEVIARRILSFLPAVATIFDNGLCTGRFGSPHINFSQRPAPAELQAVRECYEKRQTVRIDEYPLHISAYYLPETNGVRRIILISEIDDF